MDKDTLIRTAPEAPSPASEAHETPPDADDQPTECGLTRQELRILIEAMIG